MRNEVRQEHSARSWTYIILHNLHNLGTPSVILRSELCRKLLTAVIK